MSCKGILLPQTRNGSGQIEDECINKFEDPLGLRKNGEFSSIITSSVLPDINQDVAGDSGNGENISASVLEVTPSTNFVLSSNTEITSDLVGMSLDEWFKQRNDAAMDINSVLTTDAVENNDLEGYHLLASKDNVDMCIVTNICDMGLGFDLPVNICDKNSQPLSVCDSDERIVNSFDQSSFLDDFARNDVIDKNMMIKVENSGLPEKCDFLDNCGLAVKEVENYVLNAQVSDEKVSKNGEWVQNEECFVQSLPVTLADAEKVKWESLSVMNQQSNGCESEKEVDFPNFSLLTFQVDASEGVNVINSLSQRDSGMEKVNKIPEVPDNIVLSKTFILPDTVSCKTLCNIEASGGGNCVPKEPRREETVQTVKSSMKNSVRTEPLIAPVGNSVESKRRSLNILQRNPCHPRSLLKPPAKTVASLKPPKTAIETESFIKKVSETCNNGSTPVSVESETVSKVVGSIKKYSKAPAMTIIAISTDKSKNTTEIVINTSSGEQKFKGKTSDFIKATSNSLTNSQVVKAKIGQSLALPAAALPSVPQQQPQLQELPVAELSAQDGAPAAVAEVEEGEWAEREKNKAADEEVVVEALESLGIDATSLTYVMRGDSGYKVWPCPIPNCTKSFPRQSVLKVHILTHYGMRPYRCDVSGCHWTFYTLVKLKRHKETHLKRKAFVCPVEECGHRFTTIYNLKTHRKLHERPAKLQCPVEGCNAFFQTKRGVELHVKNHGISHAPYQCEYEGCGKRYYSCNTLNSHARRHQHREEEVRCQWADCGKWFDKPCRLRAHMRSHTGDKPYPCTFQDCNWAFSSASKLKRHQQKHTNERKFLCSFEGCGKSFMRSEHLKEHIQTHIGERSYKCPVDNCGVKFTAKSSLYVHLKKHKQQQQQIQLQLQQPQQLELQLQPLLLLQEPLQQQKHQQLQPKQQEQEQQQQMTSLPVLTEITSGQLNCPTAQILDIQVPVVASVAEARAGAGAGTLRANAFPCPMEHCSKTYGSKSRLRFHLLRHHTPLPLLTSDANQLELLSTVVTQSGLAAGDGPQLLLQQRPSASTPVSAITAPCAAASVVTSAVESSVLPTSSAAPAPAPATAAALSEGDLSHCPAEFINTDLLSTPHILVVSASEASAQASDDPSCRAARTCLTYQDTMNLKPHGRRGGSGADSSMDTGNGSGGISGMLVGLRDPVTALRLPPDMAGLLAPTSELGLMLPEDSGLQVLLLDGCEAQAFPESTINLRDLE